MPLGSHEPSWPEWVKERHPFSNERGLAGCVQYWGDVPYREPTPRQLLIYRDFPITQQHMRLKTRSVREALTRYVPGPVFEQWIGRFVTSLDMPAHRTALWRSAGNLLTQFNLVEPGVSLPAADALRLVETEPPNVGRLALQYSDTRYHAANYPKLILAFMLYQAAAKPYLERVHLALMPEGMPLSYEDGNASLVLMGEDMQTLNTFIVGSLLQLVLLKRMHDFAAVKSNEQAVPLAISAAWETLFRRRLLRRDFNSSIMICPAYQHLRYAKERRLIERLYGFVCAHMHEPIIAEPVGLMRRRAVEAVVDAPRLYWQQLAAGLLNNTHARGGRGLRQS